MSRHVVAGVLLLTVGGCSLIPDYERPPLPVAAAYPAGPAYPSSNLSTAQALQSADTIGWRDFFADPQLQTLVEISLRNNRNLRIAALNIASAQAQYRIQRSDLFPHISLSGIGQFGTLPEQTSIASGGFGGGSGGTGAAASTTSSAASLGSTGTTSAIATAPTAVTTTPSQHISYRYYNVGLGFASYELDLFGRLRSLTSQALETYLANIETARSTQISLIAEVASAYFTVLADRELLRITNETVKSEEDAYNLTMQQFRGGTTTLLSVRQAETALETARANVPLYVRQAAVDENALVLLLGQPIPADLPLGRGLDHQDLMTDLPAGLPSDLLLRRPDIVAAEHNLLAANASIGAARAAFFPSISLTSTGGVAGSQLSRLFTAGGLTWSFAPQINLPIFTAGQNQGNLDLAKVQTSIQVATYEQTIQTAFREVSDALAGLQTYVDQVKAQQRLVDASADSLRLSLLRFQGGVDSFLPVLQAQQSLYPAQQNLLSLKQAQLTNYINLYKALGGGLVERTVARTEVPATAPLAATPAINQVATSR